MAFGAALLLLFSLSVAGQNTALREAAALDSQHKCAESETLYERALSAGSPSLALLNNVGNHYLVCGDEVKAQYFFERVLAKNPQHTNANLQLARIATGRRDGLKALQYLARVIDTDAPTALLRAEALHWAGKRAEAKAALDSLLPQISRDERLLRLYGNTCARTEDWQQAEGAFSKLLSLHPGDFDLLLDVGRSAARAGHAERARGVLDTAVKLRPDSVVALTAAGAAAAQAGDYTRAVFYLAQAHKLAPARFDVALALAQSARNGGYYGDAALAYDACLQLRPNDIAVQRDRAFTEALTDSRRNEGIRDLTAWVASHPGDPVGHFELAQISWRENPENALAALTKALELDPALTPALVSRAWLLTRLGRGVEAIVDLERAEAAEPANIRVLDQLGQLYTSAERLREAEAALRRAFAIAPRDPDVLLHLSRALMEAGKDDEADRILAQYRSVRPEERRAPWKEAGLIDLATLSAPERAQREIERLRRDSGTHPDDPELRFRLAALLMSSGRTGEGSREFQELANKSLPAGLAEQAGKFLLDLQAYSTAATFLIRAAEAKPGANLDLAIARWGNGDSGQALEALARTPGADQSGDCLLLKAILLEKSEHFAEASEALDRGLRLPVSRVPIIGSAVSLLIGRNRDQDALALLQRAGSEDPDLLISRARLLAALGRSTDADHAFREVEERWPESDRAWVAHGLLLERTRPREAVQKLRTGIALGSSDPAARCALARMGAGSAESLSCAEK